MSLDTLYEQRKNLTIPAFDGNAANDGQCVQWALLVRMERDSLPIRYGNAIDWWTNRGTDVTYYDYIPYAPGIYPKAGDFVVWDARVGSKFGHIDVAKTDGDASGFWGYDSNWGGKPVLKLIRHDYSLGVVGYIRKKGTNMQTSPNDGDVDNAFLMVNGRKATDQEKKDFTSKPWNDENGLFYGKIKVDFENIQRFLVEAQKEVSELKLAADPKVAAFVKALKDVLEEL